LRYSLISPLPLSFFSDASYDGFHPELVGDPVEKANPSREMDESKQFFELVQQFMAEYTASAKVHTIHLLLMKHL
jgi:hypothetical protein